MKDFNGTRLERFFFLQFSNIRTIYMRHVYKRFRSRTTVDCPGRMPMDGIIIKRLGVPRSAFAVEPKLKALSGRRMPATNSYASDRCRPRTLNNAGCGCCHSAPFTENCSSRRRGPCIQWTLPSVLLHLARPASSSPEL